MKKFLALLTLFIFIQSCDDKKTQEFGGINLTIQKQEYSSEDTQVDIDVDISIKQEDFELKPLKEKKTKKALNPSLIFNDYRVKIINEISKDDLRIESLESQIADVDAVRVTLNSGDPTTIPIINGTASYSRDGLAVGVMPIKVDLIGNGIDKYTQTKSVNIVANQNASVAFNSFNVTNQEISIISSNFGNTVVQGDQLTFAWTNTHAERPVQISVIQNNDINNVIQILESSYIATNYVLNTSNSNPINNIGFKVSSTVAANTSSSICCFDLVSNNQGPTVENMTVSTNEDEVLEIQLDGSDNDGDSLTYTIVSSPSNGTLSSINNDILSYTPSTDYNGSDSFAYRANDGTADSNTATVTIAINSVNDAPTTNDVSTTIDENRIARIADITLDGSDVDGDNLTFILQDNPSNGTATINGDVLTYNADQDWNGVETFSYKANDGQVDSNISSITITVNAVNDDPVTTEGPYVDNTASLHFAAGGSVAQIPHNQNEASDNWTLATWVKTESLSAAGFISKGYYMNGDTHTGFSLRRGGDQRIFFLVSKSIQEYQLLVSSSIPLIDEWFYVAIVNDYNSKTVKMYMNGQLEDEFNYETLESNGDIQVNEVFAHSNTIMLGRSTQTGQFNESLTGNLDELSYWTDALTESEIQGLYNNGNGFNARSSEVGGYESAQNLEGYYQFEYDTIDNEISNQGQNGFDDAVFQSSQISYDNDTFSSTIIGTNIIHTDEDSDIQIDLSAFASDIDGDNLTYIVDSTPSNGTINLSGSTVTYSPNQDWNGTDSFQWYVSDGSSNSNITESIIKVSPVNDAPQASSFAISTGFESNIEFNLQVSDVDGDNLISSIVSNVSNGSLAFTGDNSLSYVPNSNFSGSDSFQYTVNDGTVDSGAATVSITVGSSSGGDFPEENNYSALFSENSYIDLPEIDEELGFIGSSISVSLWFKPVHDPNKDVLFHGSGSTSQYARMGFTDAGAYGKIYLCDVHCSSNNLQLSGNEDFTDVRDWNHMVYVMDGENSSLKLYINGILENEGNYSSNASFNSFDRVWQIGHLTAFNDDNYDYQGYLDDVAVWNTPLTDGEISILYNSGNMNLAHTVKSDYLKAYYDFESFSFDDKTGRDKNPISIENVGFASDVPGQYAEGASGKFEHPGSGSGAKGIKINPAGEVFANEFTLSFFLKVDMSNDSNDKVHGIMRSLLGSTTPGFALRLNPRSDSSNPGSLDFTFSDSGGETSVFSDFSFASTTDWKHVVVVKNSARVEFWIDGTYDSESDGAFNNIANDQAYIGSASFAYDDNQHLNGLMDEFAFWDQSLSPSQISNLVDNNGSPMGILDNHLKMYYQFNSDEGSTIIDHSGNDNTGTGQSGFSYSSDVPGFINANNAPTTEDIAVTIDENRTNRSMVDITLQGNDIDGDILTYYLTTTPENGSFSISGDVLTYNAYQDWNGVETFTYKANDGSDDSNTSTITITVNAINDDPVVTVGSPFNNLYSGFFNGSARVDIGTRGDLSGQDVISVQAWVAPSTSSQEIGATVIAKGTNKNSFNRQYGMYLSEDSGQLAWSWNVSTDNGVEVSTYSTNAAEISEWTHLVGTYDGSLVNLYVNGVLSSSSAHSGNINAGDSTDKPLSIGHLNGGNQYYFKGNIDEVAIWDAALSESQVNELYNYGAGKAAYDIASSTTPLHAYWNFENNVEDQSGNNRDGTAEDVSFEQYFPTGQGLQYTTDEDTPLNIDLSSIVSDVDNDNLSIDVLPATNGILTTSGLSIVYTPNLNFNGTDSFSWTVTDGTVSTASVTTDINVNSVNDAPETSNQTITTDKDSQIDITLSATDVENESLTFTIVSDVNHGTTTLNNNVITYTPSSGYAGNDSFTFKANDGTDDSNISTINITIASNNSILYMHPESTNGDGSYNNPFNNFDDVSSTLEYDTGTSYGTVIFKPGTYTSVSDNKVRINFNGNNLHIKSESGNPEDTIITVNNDTGGNNYEFQADNIIVEGLTLQNVSGGGNPLIKATHDSLVIKNIIYKNNNVTSAPVYPPFDMTNNDGYLKIYDSKFLNNDNTEGRAMFGDQPITEVYDSFFYDNIAGILFNRQTVKIENSSFIDNSEIANRIEGSRIVIDNKDYLVRNFLRAEISNSILRNVEAGIWATDNPGTIKNSILIGVSLNSYTNGNYYWGDYYNLKLNSSFAINSNGESSVEGEVLNDWDDIKFDYYSSSDTPNENTNYQVNHQSPAIDAGDPNDDYSSEPSPNGERINVGLFGNTFSAQVSNSAPVTTSVFASTNEDTAINIALGGSDSNNDNLTYTILTLNNGSISLSNDIATYTPNADWNGTDTFTYKANDGLLDSNISTATITVNSVEDNPFTDDMSVSTNEDTSLSIILDASDADGDDLTYLITQDNTANGNINISGNTVTYNPNQDWFGEETFQYGVLDENQNESNLSIVTITVNSVNDAPSTKDVSYDPNSNAANVGNPDVAIINEDSSWSYDLNNSTTDIENDNLSFLSDDTANNGSFNIDGSVISYSPNTNWNGIDMFDYYANDGSLDSNVSTIVLKINPVNDAPVSSNVSASTNEDNSVNITLQATDVENDNLSYAIVSDVSNGSTSLNGNIVTYTPNDDWNGTETFTYKSNDGNLDSNTATVTITVNAIDDAPTIGDPITVSVSKSTGSANINSVDFQVNISDPDVASSSDLLFYMIINNGSGFQHHAYLPSTWNAVYPGTLEEAVHTNYGSNIEIWDQSTQTFTYHAAVGRTGSENIKFYSRECGSCPLSDDYFEVTIGIN